MTAAEAACVAAAGAVWRNPSGVSAGLSHCIATFAQAMVDGRDPYALIDPALKSIKRVPLYPDALGQVPWRVSLNMSAMPPNWHHATYAFNAAEWLLPPNYRQRRGEARVFFVHGGNSADSALGSYYAGFTTRLANWTGLPVFAFDYTTDPIVPWPQNLRSVLSYLEYASSHGPDGSAMPSGKLLLVADSEGTLVLMQTLIAMHDPALSLLLGYGSVLPSPAKLVGGVVLSSPVIDVACRTPSFAWNCYNYTDKRSPTAKGVGDPDTGNCSGLASTSDKRDDCLWSYLEYFFGLAGVVRGAPRRGRHGAATAEVARRAAFFNQSILSPLACEWASRPPPH